MPRAECAEADLVESQYLRKTTEFWGGQVGAVIDGVKYPARAHATPHGERLVVQTGTMHRFFKYVAQLIFERRVGVMGRHGEIVTRRFRAAQN